MNSNVKFIYTKEKLKGEKESTLATLVVVEILLQESEVWFASVGNKYETNKQETFHLQTYSI